MNISRRDAMKLFAGSIPAYYANHAVVLAANETSTPASNAAESIGLKDAFKGKFLIGTAGDLPGGFNEAELANVIKNYDIVTPENCMKPEGVQRTEGNFTFERPDALVEWAQQNSIKVWGHTLCWHSQSPRWFLQGTREEALARLQKHIETVVGHYEGKLLGWDVVNEAIADGGDGKTENLRQSNMNQTTWYKLVGPDVLNKAFEWAHKADSKAILYYNDYNIEQDAADDSGKHPSSLLLLKRLLDEGAPINGVGIQGHWHLDTRIENIEKAILNYKALGLEVAVTELDVTAIGTNSGAFGGFGRRGAAMDPEEQAKLFEQQAEIYSKIFKIIMNNADVVKRVTFWGISDTRSWRRGQNALIFDGQMNPKPAYEAVLNVGLGKS